MTATFTPYLLLSHVLRALMDFNFRWVLPDIAGVIGIILTVQHFEECLAICWIVPAGCNGVWC